MGIGISIFLIAVGAILAFAVDYDLAGVDISTVGWILMVVGVVGILVALLIMAPRRRRAAERIEERRIYDDRHQPPRSGRVEERRVYDDRDEPPPP